MSNVLTWDAWFDLAKPKMGLFPISDPSLADRAWVSSQRDVPQRTRWVKRHVVYFLKCHDFCKVGWTKNLRDRMCMLQCGNPYDISLVYFIPCETKEEAIEIEKWVHLNLDEGGGRHRREWFDFATARRFIEWCNMTATEREEAV